MLTKILIQWCTHIKHVLLTDDTLILILIVIMHDSSFEQHAATLIDKIQETDKTRSNLN